MGDPTSSGNLSGRRFMKLGTGAAVVGGMALGGWGLTEIIVDKGPVRSWHKSVCRYLGTGYGVMVGLSNVVKSHASVTTWKQTTKVSFVSREACSLSLANLNIGQLNQKS